MIRLRIKKRCWIPREGWVFPDRIVRLDCKDPLAEVLVAYRLAKLDGRSPEHRQFKKDLHERRKRNYTDAPRTTDRPTR